MAMSGNVCVLFCFRGGKKAPTEPRVQAVVPSLSFVSPTMKTSC